MEFKEIGTIGNGSIVIKAGHVGTRRMVVLMRRDGGHILALNKVAAQELITMLRAGVRELERVGLDEEPPTVKPKKRNLK